MSLEEVTDERKIALTAHQPRHIINGQIRITEPAKPPSIDRTSPSSLLGNMDVLPLELLHAIFALLDFKTLSDISRTCSRGTAVVKSLPEYHDLMHYAPLTLTALGKTQLIRHHSSATVHAALLSSDCVSCHQYGAFLFLPTCQRCCYNCLHRNQSLWVTTLSVAKRCFDLSSAAVKTIPIMRSLPGKYWVGYNISRQRPIRLVCVGTAKRLAISEDVSEAQLRQVLETTRSARCLSDNRDYYMLRHLEAAPLSPPGSSFLMRGTESNVPNDMYCGMASMPFPFLAARKQIEYGFWCLGCELVQREWHPNSPIPDHLAHLLTPGCLADDVVHKVQDVAWSRLGFLCHVDQCPGAKKLIRSG